MHQTIEKNQTNQIDQTIKNNRKKQTDQTDQFAKNDD